MSQENPGLGAVPPLKTKRGIEITLVGEAEALANDLARELDGVGGAADVVYIGLAVLRAARGKELRVFDTRTGTTETLDI